MASDLIWCGHVFDIFLLKRVLLTVGSGPFGSEVSPGCCLLLLADTGEERLLLQRLLSGPAVLLKPAVSIESKHEVTILSGLNEFVVKFHGPAGSKDPPLPLPLCIYCSESRAPY